MTEEEQQAALEAELSDEKAKVCALEAEVEYLWDLRFALDDEEKPGYVIGGVP